MVITVERIRELVNLHKEYSHDFSKCWGSLSVIPDTFDGYTIEGLRVVAKHPQGVLYYYPRLFEANHHISLKYINGKLMECYFDMNVENTDGSIVQIFDGVTTENPFIPKIIRNVRDFLYGKDCHIKLWITHYFDIQPMEKLD